MTEYSETFDTIKTVGTILSPFLASYLTYIFAIKGKQRDTDFEKRNELNNVLSHLLVVWNYLTRLDEISKMKFDNAIKLPIPKDYLSFILLKSGTLNDSIFHELEEAIKCLRKHDPMSFYELEGIGRRLEFLKRSFILPFIKSKSNSGINKTISDKYLKLTIADIEEFIKSISSRIDTETKSKAEDKLQTHLEKNSQKLINEILQEYYEIIFQINPNHSKTFEQFKTDIEKPEYQNYIAQQFDMINHIGIDKLMEIAADDPKMSMEQVAMEILRRQMNEKDIHG